MEIDYGRYYNKNLAVTVRDRGCPFGVLSTNIEGVELSPDEFVVKQWSENASWAKIENFPMFEDTGRRVFVSQFVPAAPVWRRKPELDASTLAAVFGAIG